MIFAFQNLIENYTLTGTAFSDTFTIENIKDRKLTKIWKGTSTDANQRIVIDAGADITPELISILGHNFTTETISIQANTSDSWVGVLPVDYTFTSILDIMNYFYTGTAYRYWSIYIENCVIPATPPEIGLVYMGDSLEFVNPSTITPSNVDDNTVWEKSADNTLNAYKGETMRQSFQLNFNGMFDADFDILKNTIFAAVGKAYPMIIIWDVNYNYAIIPNLYCNFITGISIDDVSGYLTGASLSSVTFSIEECN